ncbi:hypothetical protein WR25_08040 [Diploscapter pachys]|uniref:Peptidase M13 C-terminal domain-containing protein n=1 Tax=Diploscapter pachys TaxID=2018661 RepID=A0A2A2JE15_9BILA|nr:hypothetical protein WR25_08040 [Diploscapter pachys]
MGSWPMVDDSWEESEYHLTNLLVNATITRHESIFFDIQNTPDFLKRDKNNTDKAIIHVMNLKSMFGEKFHEIYLDPEWHNEEIDIIREYLKMNVKHFMADTGISRNESDISDDIDEIIQFETQIVNLLKEASNNDPSDQLKFARISDLKEHFPLINWEHFMVEVYPTALESYILHNPRIIIQDTSLLTRVSELVSKTEPRIIVNYVMLRYALSWNNEIGTKYELLWQALESSILHENKVEMRWKNCMDIATKTMSHATGAMWLREYFDKESKSIVDQIVTDIRMTFIEILNENKWMGNETKQAAIVKVRQMTKHIAYPELEINDKKLDKYYKHLHINPNLTFSDNYEEILNWHFVKGAYHILEPYEIEFITNSNDFEAEYIQEKNTIVISAPIIRAPFFDKDAPFSFNYAAIGSVIGHELIHGFDHEGMYYDEKGEYRDWWDEGSKNEFYRRAECIVKQYSRVKVVDKKHRIDGNQTLIWCQNYEIRQQFHRLQSDEHSPGFARVNIPLANMPEFAKAYACPIGSRMNPSSRCTVWGDDVDPTTAYDDAKQIQMKEIAKLLLKVEVISF